MIRFSFLLFAMNTLAWGKPVFDYCKELEISRPLKVNISRKESKTFIQLSYTLLRSEENTYDVYLNPKFTPAPKYDSHYPEKADVSVYFKKKMNECFEESRNTLVDENNRKLRLHVYDKKVDRIPAPPLININVQTENRRSNSENFSSNIDCHTLMHETFHYLGLVDEYQELSMGYDPVTYTSDNDRLVPVSDSVLPAYDCRPIGADFSLMKDPTALGFGQNFFSGHLNTVIYPNCDTRNSKYYTCAAFAYKTSSRHKDFLNDKDDCAKKVPEYCKNDGWYKVD